MHLWFVTSQEHQAQEFQAEACDLRVHINVPFSHFLKDHGNTIFLLVSTPVRSNNLLKATWEHLNALNESPKDNFDCDILSLSFFEFPYNILTNTFHDKQSSLVWS